MYEQKKNSSDKNNTRLVLMGILSAVAVTVIALASLPSLPPTYDESDHDSEIVESTGIVVSEKEAFNQIKKAPPPRPWSMWGTKVASFDQAKMDIGIQASLPTAVSSELHLESIRIKASSESRYMFAIYTPQGITAESTDTFEDTMNNGGILVVYAKEKRSPDFNAAEWMKRFANEFPDVRRVDTINGQTAVIYTGKPDQGITSGVLFWKNDVQINIVSLKHDDLMLKRIAESIP